MNKEETVEKIRKIGKAGYIISVILQVCVIVALVACILGTVILYALPYDMITFKMSGKLEMSVDTSSFKNMTDANVNSFENGNLNIGDNKYVIVEVNESENGITAIGEFDDTVIRLGDFRKLIIIAIISLGFASITTIFAKKFFKALKECNSPFEESISTRFKHLAYSLIPWVFMSSIINNISAAVVSGGEYSFSFSVNLSTVLVILFIIAVAYIFGYGAELQRESDETL